MNNQFAKTVVRSSHSAGIVLHGNGAEPLSPPGEEHIDRNKRAVKIGKSPPSAGAEGSKRTHIACRLGPHGGLEREFRDQRSDIAPETMLFLKRYSINNVIALVKSRQELRNLLRGIL